MDVTVAVIPRERFRPLPASLNSLFATIPAAVRVVVIDGGADESVRRELRRLQRERGFELITSERFLLPNEARNVALDLVETKYVAFCDNDLGYSPGWLQALVANAERNDSVAVSPVTLIGPSDPQIIHHAGGDLTLVKDESGHTRLRRHHRLGRVRLPDAELTGFGEVSLEHDYFEYHCVLVDVDTMRKAGGHDERLVMHEHLDSSLRLKADGGRITFEPGARVMYTAFNRFVDEDWPYFLYRWSINRARTSNRVFAGNWGVTEDSGYAELHRNRAMLTVLPRLPRLLNRHRVKQAMLRLYRPGIIALQREQPDAPAARTLARPAPDALEKTGIKVTGTGG